MSKTRWSDRLQSIKPFASHLTSIQLALQDLLELTLTAKTSNGVNGVLAYLKSFVCVLVLAVWYKVLAPIDICNKVIQARDATLDVEVSNIETLLEDLISYEATGQASGMKPKRWHQILRWKSNSSMGVEAWAKRE